MDNADTPRYNHEAAERHWRSLFHFFRMNLAQEHNRTRRTPV